MSDNRNILELLVDCAWDCGVSASKMIFKFLGVSWNEHDFKKFFCVVQLKNSNGEYPKLEKSINEGVYKVYRFDVPIGLILDDFNKTLKQLSLFMKTSEESIKFKLLEDFSGIELRVLRLEEFFRQIELKNNEYIYPKLKREYREDLADVYVFNRPSGLTIGEFRKVLIKISDYFKLDINKLQFIEIKDESIEEVELRIFR